MKRSIKKELKMVFATQRDSPTKYLMWNNVRWNYAVIIVININNEKKMKQIGLICIMQIFCLLLFEFIAISASEGYFIAD